MHLNIKPIHHGGLDCFEDFLIAIASYYNREYPLAFSDAFGFEYLPADPKFPSIFGNRINSGSADIIKLIKKYTKICIKKKVAGKTAEKALEIMKEQLLKNLPVALEIETFWCPWSEDYQRLHSKHFCLAIGIDQDNGIECIDPVLTKNICILPFSEFKNGLTAYITFKIGRPPRNINHVRILQKSVKKVINSNIFNNIKVFNSDFRSFIDFHEEFIDFENGPWSVFIIRSLSFIAGGRFLFAQFIKYIAPKIENADLSEFSSGLEQSRSKWDMVRSILTKSYYTGYTDITKNEVFNLVEQIADSEKNMFYHLNAVLNCRNKSVKSDINNQNHPIYAFQDVNNFVHVDLKAFYNCIAFNSTASADCLADFSGIGDYFLTDASLDGKILDAGGMKFQFPVISDNCPENVSCDRQKIYVPNGTYESIMLLASSDIGSYTEYIQLNFINNEAYKIEINFSDWWLDIPVFDEQVAWSGKVFNKKSNCYQNKNYSLFALQRSISSNNTLESIVLPDNSNIHIFAVTLYKA